MNYFYNFWKMSLKPAIIALVCSICDLNDSLMIWCALPRLSLCCSTLRSHIFSSLSCQSLSLSSRLLFPFRVDFSPFRIVFAFLVLRCCYLKSFRILPLHFALYFSDWFKDESLLPLTVAVLSICIFDGSTLSRWPITIIGETLFNLLKALLTCLLNS